MKNEHDSHPGRNVGRFPAVNGGLDTAPKKHIISTDALGTGRSGGGIMRRTYEKPAVVYKEKVEARAGSCGKASSAVPTCTIVVS